MVSLNIRSASALRSLKKLNDNVNIELSSISSRPDLSFVHGVAVLMIHEINKFIESCGGVSRDLCKFTHFVIND